jgi:hypothetical protein
MLQRVQSARNFSVILEPVLGDEDAGVIYRMPVKEQQISSYLGRKCAPVSYQQECQWMQPYHKCALHYCIARGSPPPVCAGVRGWYPDYFM